MNSLPKTVTRQRRDCDLNPGPYAPESSTLTTRLPTWYHGSRPIIDAAHAEYAKQGLRNGRVSVHSSRLYACLSVCPVSL